MVHRVDERRQAERVREEDEFLACLGANLADLGEELNGGPASAEGRGSVPHSLVEVRERERERETHIHSSVVRLTSRAKLCRWLTSFSKTNFCLRAGRRGSARGRARKRDGVERWTHLGFSHSELMAWTFSVMVSGDMSVRLGSLDCRAAARGWGEGGGGQQGRSSARVQGQGRTRSMSWAPCSSASWTARPTCSARRVHQWRWDEGRRRGERTHLGGGVRGRVVDVVCGGHGCGARSRNRAV